MPEQKQREIREEMNTLLDQIQANEAAHTVLQNRINELRAQCNHPRATKDPDPEHEICYHHCPDCKHWEHHAGLCS